MNKFVYFIFILKQKSVVILIKYYVQYGHSDCELTAYQ